MDGSQVTLSTVVTSRLVRHHRGRSMSPSRPFILRPVATSLLMAAILLVGIVAFFAIAGFGAA